MAKINLTRAITLTKDDGTSVELTAGENTVDKDVAAHWFVKAHAVGNEVSDENEAQEDDAAKGKTTSGKSTG